MAKISLGTPFPQQFPQETNMASSIDRGRQLMTLDLGLGLE